jgi:hypothetical protein
LPSRFGRERTPGSTALCAITASRPDAPPERTTYAPDRPRGLGGDVSKYFLATIRRLSGIGLSKFLDSFYLPAAGGLLEQLGDQCKSLWGTSSELYFRVDKLLNQLANPNLHDIPSNLQIRVELWDRYDKHIRWVIAATSSIVIGNAAYDVAVSVHPQERVLLRQGIRVIREHVPKSKM